MDLGVSPALIGYQVATVFCGTMLSALLGGGLVRRLGAARTLQLALWMVAAGSGISAFATLPALAFGALVMGLGYGVVNPAASHLLARASSARNMNLIFSIKQGGVPIGGTLAGLLVPIVTLAWGWVADRLRSGTRTMIIVGLIAIVCSLAIAAIAADWPVWLIAVIAALFGFSAMGWNGVFFATVVRLSPPQAAGSVTGGAIFWSSAAVAVAPAAFAALHDHAGVSYSGGYAMLALVTAAGIACFVVARRSRVT